MARVPGILCAAIVLALGCGGDDDAPDADVPAPDAGHSTVLGKAVITFHPDGEPEDLPANLLGFPIDAVYFDGNGEPHVYPGEGTQDGRFTILDVPEAPVDVRIGAFDHVVTSTRSLDIGYDRPGRSDWLGTSSGTQLVFNVDGMTAWTAEDELALFTGNLGFHHPFLTFDALMELAPGATALTDYAVDWSFWPLIEGAKGDWSRLIHYGIYRKPTTGDQIQLATQVLELEPFDQIDGDATLLSGSFTTLPKTETIRLEWAFSTFDAMRTRVHPEAFGPFSANFEMYAQPGGVESEVFSFGPMVMQGWTFDLKTNIDFGNIDYANPFPAEWPLYILAYASFAVELTNAEGTLSTYGFADMFYSADLETYGDGPIALQLLPVGNLKIGGHTAYGFPGGFGTTPLVTWNGPDIANGYEILVVHAFDDGTGDTRVEYIARFRTAESELRFPPDLLVEGEYYYMVVSAIYMPDVDFASEPYRHAMVRGRADVVSDLFTP